MCVCVCVCVCIPPQKRERERERERESCIRNNISITGDGRRVSDAYVLLNVLPCMCVYAHARVFVPVNWNRVWG